MESLQLYMKILRKSIRILLELCSLVLLGAFIYLEKLFHLLKQRPGKSLEGEVILVLVTLGSTTWLFSYKKLYSSYKVTGSANGLGKEICRELVKHRAKLVLWDVSEEVNRKTAQELIELGAEHVFHDTVDVSDRDQVVRAASKMRKTVGQVTVLVNNAGICPMQQFLELTPEAVHSTFQTNVVAHFWTIQEFLPHMLKTNKGHIVTICSTMGQMAIRGPAPYYASKHAVHGFIECLKDELAHFPVNPNIIFTTAYPFFMRTRMVQGDNCGLILKFRFPSITPFMEASEVATRIVHGIRQEREFLYIPETFRVYLAIFFFLPSKLHRRCVDFFVEESGYSVQLGSANGCTAASKNAEKHTHQFRSFIDDANPKSSKLGSEFAAIISSWHSGIANTEKEK